MNKARPLIMHRHDLCCSAQTCRCCLRFSVIQDKRTRNVVAGTTLVSLHQMEDIRMRRRYLWGPFDQAACLQLHGVVRLN